jgi:hypothetical protein
MQSDNYETLLQNYVERAQSLPEKVARLASAQQAVLQQLQRMAITLRSMSNIS